jgi:hypothetical protein
MFGAFAKMVEAPGTAPGSTTLIPRTVYRHSRRTGEGKYRDPAPRLQGSPQLSVVLLKVHPNGVFALPLEGQAPRTVPMNRIADRAALQPVEVEAGSIDIAKLYRCVQTRITAGSVA